MDTQLAVTGGSSPAQVMMEAVSKGADLSQLEKMMELQERWERNEARKAYVEAMAAFKNDCPEIFKDKKNEQYKSWYSSIDAIVNTVIPKLSEYGFSHNWQYGNDGDLLKVTCVLTHRLGHSESASVTAPPDKSGSKNDLQQRKSTRTYLKIETFEAVTGIVSKENNLNDDGNAAGVLVITEKQLSTLRDMMSALDVKEDAFCTYLKVGDLETLPRAKYQQALTALKAKEKKALGGAK